jgi:hypothetical protein
MKLLRIDEQGYFIEDVIKDKRPTIPEVKVDEEGKEYTVEVPDPHYITTPCPGGFYRPKWDGEKWVEAMKQSDIDAIVNAPRPKTELEKLQEIVDMLLMDSLEV